MSEQKLTSDRTELKHWPCTGGSKVRPYRPGVNVAVARARHRPRFVSIGGAQSSHVGGGGHQIRGSEVNLQAASPNELARQHFTSHSKAAHLLVGCQEASDGSGEIDRLQRRCPDCGGRGRMTPTAKT